MEGEIDEVWDYRCAAQVVMSMVKEEPLEQHCARTGARWQSAVW